MASINITPPSGQITATVDAVHVRCEDADVWNADGTQKRYRFRLTPPAGAEAVAWSAYSHLFNVSEDGKHAWHGYIFPVSGSWTVRLFDEEEETDAATLAVTVA